MVRSRRRLPVAGSTLGLVLLLLFLAVAVQATGLLPGGFGAAAHSALGAVMPASLVAAAAMVLAVLAAAVVLGRPGLPGEAGEEEPLLPAPRVPSHRGRCPLIAVVDLEAVAGASGLAFNLAVLAAVEGAPAAAADGGRRPRALCLLSPGRLSEALQLSPEPMRRHLERNSGRVVADLVEMAVRHPAGCELLCLPRGCVGRHQLRLLRHALDRHYDLILVDCASDDARLREGAEDVADVLLAVGLPSPRSSEAALDLLEGAMVYHRLASTVLVVNQVRARWPLPSDLVLGFEHSAFLPWEKLVIEADRRGQPWCLLASSTMGRTLRRLAAELVPELLVEAKHAARD